MTIVTMGHFIEMEQRYLNGDMTEPESESFLEPEKITPSEFFFLYSFQIDREIEDVYL